ncbi:hypothetical protein BD413DRAFT_42633 [Trametes elegans]|nr:hypothetical protein BD413DRAFT_42633 [Trametes elegans]
MSSHRRNELPGLLSGRRTVSVHALMALRPSWYYSFGRSWRWRAAPRNKHGSRTGTDSEPGRAVYVQLTFPSRYPGLITAHTTGRVRTRATIVKSPGVPAAQHVGGEAPIARTHRVARRAKGTSTVFCSTVASSKVPYARHERTYVHTQPAGAVTVGCTCTAAAKMTATAGASPASTR